MKEKSKQNLVLDMDELLLTTLDLSNTTDVNALLSQLGHVCGRLYVVQSRDVFHPRGSGVEDNTIAIERPHLQTFLRYVFDRFENVIVWSAGQCDYVHANIGYVSRFCDEKFQKAMHRQNCGTRSDGILCKPLEYLFKEDGPFDWSNTFIMDDNDDNFSESNPKNGIHVPAFTCSVDELEDAAAGKYSQPDHALLQAIRFFERPEVKTAKDIRSPEVQALKDHMFTPAALDAILRTHIAVPRNGNAMFSALVKAITHERVFATGVTETIRLRRAVDPVFQYLASQVNPTEDLSVENMRLLIAANAFTDKESLGRHQKYAVTWARKELHVASMDTDKFLTLLLDEKSFPGDREGLEYLSRTLFMDITMHAVSDGTIRPVFEIKHANPIGRANIMSFNGTYEALV